MAKTNFMNAAIFVVILVLAAHVITNGTIWERFGLQTVQAPGTTVGAGEGTGTSQSCLGIAGITATLGPVLDKFSSTTDPGANITLIKGGSLNGEVISGGVDDGVKSSGGTESLSGNAKIVLLYGAAEATVYHSFAEEYQLDCNDVTTGTLSDELGDGAHRLIQVDTTPTWTVKGATGNSDDNENESVSTGGTGTWFVTLSINPDTGYGVGATAAESDNGKILWAFFLNDSAWDPSTISFNDAQGPVQKIATPDFLSVNNTAQDIRTYVTEGTGKSDGGTFTDRWSFSIQADDSADPVADGTGGDPWAFVVPYNWLEDASTSTYIYGVETSLGVFDDFIGNSSVRFQVQ